MGDGQAPVFRRDGGMGFSGNSGDFRDDSDLVIKSQCHFSSPNNYLNSLGTIQSQQNIPEDAHYGFCITI
ncbi:hypothetical protein MishRS11D_36770 [Methylomagnum ishizawai]|nr:hypothetical protein MishRS11D_36770 [Methylomagnum ishizawai]